MTQTQRIASELRQALSGPAWHGASLLELLDGVTAELAAAKPIAGAHSIHEIVLHLTKWVTLAADALRGQPIPEWPFPDDWRETRPASWESDVGALRSRTEDLAAAAEHLPEQRLEEIVPGRTFTIGFLLLGIVQHAGYHGGQIALLKKSARV